MSLKRKASKVKVAIVGGGFTSLAAARSYVRNNRAEWEKGTLRFLDSHHGHRSAMRNMLDFEARNVMTHYGEGEGIARIDQIQGLPLAGPAVRLLTGKRTRKVMDYPTVELGAFRLPDMAL